MVVPFPIPNTRNGTTYLQLLSHSVYGWQDIFHMEFDNDFVSLFQSSEIVRHVVLGIAACHLRHLDPGNHRHRRAEYFYQALAISSYRQRTESSLGKATLPEVIELLLSGMLLHVLAFPLPYAPEETKHTITEDRPFSQQPTNETLKWLILQAGLRLVMRAAPDHMDAAMDVLRPIFRSAHGIRPMAKAGDFSDVPQDWIKFFELKPDATSAVHENPPPQITAEAARLNTSYQEAIMAPLVQAARLKNLQPTDSNIFHHFTFLAKMHPRFRGLLQRGDIGAIWLYGFWAGLMCRFRDLWWAQQRSQRDHAAILDWLRGLKEAERGNMPRDLWNRMIVELEEAPFMRVKE